MTIRIMSAQDIETYREPIYRYLDICFQTAYGKSDDDLINSKIDRAVGFINDGKAYVFGAFAENIMVGFLWGYPVEGPFETVFHIAYLAVDERERKKGIGKALISTAEAYAKELHFNHVELIVDAGNYNALGFYEHAGYKPDRYFMRK